MQAIFKNARIKIVKYFNKIVNWLKRFLAYRRKGKYEVANTAEFPNPVKENTIYIVKEGSLAETLIFKCPCGCSADIYLNLLKDTRPRWKYSLINGKITISPSVWRINGCKSHFLIEKGSTIWASPKRNRYKL